MRIRLWSLRNGSYVPFTLYCESVSQTLGNTYIAAQSYPSSRFLRFPHIQGVWPEESDGRARGRTASYRSERACLESEHLNQPHLHVLFGRLHSEWRVDH